MAKKKYYAVRNGRQTGIFATWAECQKQVIHFPAADFKSFESLAEAEAFLSASKGAVPETQAEEAGTVSRNGSDGLSSVGSDQALAAASSTAFATSSAEPEIYAFVDGSFNIATGVYGYGGFLVDHGTKYVLQGSGHDAELASMRNVAGEILGSTAAIRKAIDLGLPEVAVYYDYMGIEKWATGEWKRNKEGTKAYHAFIQESRDKIAIRFVKVKGHSGVAGNEEADRLAKEAVGIV